MKTLTLWLALALCCVYPGVHPVSAFAAQPPMEGFVAVSGIRLQYLDWGGTGPALILIHGLGDNPHVFDDLAPAFTDRFHVIGYARRGSGGSDAVGPYDVTTLTEDLRGLMQALGITKAILVGHSAGGDEITEMAALHPDEVDRIIYLDAAYDWTDPDFRAGVPVRPLGAFDRPESAMESLDALRAYQKTTWYPDLDDMMRIEANLRDKVVIQPDGSLRDRTTKEVMEAQYTALSTGKPRQYNRVSCPALAIYAEHLYDWHIADNRRREQFVRYENKYWAPFRAKSVDRIRHELPDVEVHIVPGSHPGFFMTDRSEVVALMRSFLNVPPQGSITLTQSVGARRGR